MVGFFLSLKKKEREFSRFDKSVVVETELEIHRYDRSLLLYDSSIISKLSDYQETINETTINNNYRENKDGQLPLRLQWLLMVSNEQMINPFVDVIVCSLTDISSRA